jgi:large subunit ribosomal protein L9
MAQIKLILREQVEKLGQAGDVVSVKPGFARNFLLPQGKASMATEARISELEHHRRIISEHQARELSNLKAFKKKIESTVLEVAAAAGEEGKLFGSVTLQQVASLLAEKGIDLDRRKLRVSEPIKSLGEHSVEVRLHPELSATFKVAVVASQDAAS